MKNTLRPARSTSKVVWALVALAMAAGGAFWWSQRHRIPAAANGPSEGIAVTSSGLDAAHEPPQNVAQERVAPPKFVESSTPETTGDSLFLANLVKGRIEQFAGKEEAIDAVIPKIAPRVPLTPHQVATLQRWNHVFANTVRSIYSTPITSQEDFRARNDRFHALQSAQNKARLQLFNGDTEAASRSQRMIGAAAAGLNFDKGGWPVPNEFGVGQHRVTTKLWERDTTEFHAIFD